MALKDLGSILKKKEIEKIPEPCKDAFIACDILEWLFSQIIDSLSRDRSYIKLNMFEKGAVESGSNRILPGVKKYLKGMRPEELDLLLNGIEEKLIERDKNLNMQRLMDDNFRLRKELEQALLRS